MNFLKINSLKKDPLNKYVRIKASSVFFDTMKPTTARVRIIIFVCLVLLTHLFFWYIDIFKYRIYFNISSIMKYLERIYKSILV